MNQNSIDAIKPRNHAVSVMSKWVICVDDMNDEASNEVARELLTQAGYDPRELDAAGERIDETVFTLLATAFVRAPALRSHVENLVHIFQTGEPA